MKNDGGNGMLVISDPKPPNPDSSALCGSLVVPIEVDRTNFYFVVDASGSMDEMIDESSRSGRRLSRYRAARAAIGDVLRVVGHRVSYGATLFPGRNENGDPGCPPGDEIFETTPGDPVSFAVSGEDGPLLTRLLTLISRRSPEGLTPTAATLRALTDRLLALEGETFVFLITDGAPNCNAAARCSAADCTANIQGLCPPEANCCDPEVSDLDWRWCLDAEPTLEAVEALADERIKTFVIGMPGTGAYAELLDQLALAGQTARDRSPFYYPVDTADELATTLKRIGTEVAVECTLELEQAPPDAELVNVYFDADLVPNDPDNGWTWTAEDAIELVGKPCRLLKGGHVLQVQVAAGCPTVVR